MPINNLDTPKKSSNRKNDTNSQSSTATATAMSTETQDTASTTTTVKPSSPITRNRNGNNNDTDDRIKNDKRRSKRILIPTDSTSKLVEQITQEVNETLPWVSYDTNDTQSTHDINITTNNLRKRFTNDRGRRLQGLFHKNNNNHDNNDDLNKNSDSMSITPSFDITEEEIQVNNNNNNNNKDNKSNPILNQTSLLKRLEFFYKDPVDKSIRRCIFRKNLEFEFTDIGIQIKTNTNNSIDQSQYSSSSSIKTNDITLPFEQIKSIDVDKDLTINNFMIKLKNTKSFYDSVGLINQFYKIWIFFNTSGENNIKNYKLIIESFKNSNLVLNFLTNDEMNDSHSISSDPIPPNSFYPSSSSSKSISNDDDSTVSYGSNSDSISKRMRTRSTTKLKDYTFPQLTEIQEIFENIPFENQIIFKPSLKYKFEDKKSFIITNNDFKCLYNGNWVNDTIVDFFLKYYFTQATKSGKLNNLKIEVLNSFFYKKLLMDIDEENQNYYNNVKNWFKNNDNLFNQDFVIIPIMEDMHWFFVIITNLPKLKSKALKSEFNNSHDNNNTNTDGSIIINSQINMNNDLNSPSSSLPSPKNDDSSSTNTNNETTPKKKLGRPSKNSMSKPQLPIKNSVSNKLSDEDYIKNYDENSKIYILDSLKKAHPGIYEPLRGFLRGYAKEKYNVDIPSDQIYKASCPIPQQGNFNDCGLHVVYNAAKLFWHPDLFKSLLIKPTVGLRKQLFKESERRTLRKDLRDLLLGLLKKNVELSGGDSSKIGTLTNGQFAENTNINGNISNISNNNNSTSTTSADTSKSKNGNNSDTKEDSDQEITNKKNDDTHYSSGGNNGTRNNLNNIEYDNSSISQNSSNEIEKGNNDQKDMDDDMEDDDELEIISENVKNSESSKKKDSKSTRNSSLPVNGDYTGSNSIQRPFTKTLKQRYSDHDRQLGKPSNLKNDNLIKVQYKSNSTNASLNNEITTNSSLSDGNEPDKNETRESNKYLFNIKSDNDTTRVIDSEREKERQRIIELEKENELLKEKLREQVREMNLIEKRRNAELKSTKSRKETPQDESKVDNDNDDDEEEEEDKMEIDDPVSQENDKDKDTHDQNIYDQNLVDYKSSEASTASSSQREKTPDALEVNDSQDSVLSDIKDDEPSPSGIIASLESIEIAEPVTPTKKNSLGISEESAIIINTKSDETNDEADDSKPKENNVSKSPKTEIKSSKAEIKSSKTEIKSPKKEIKSPKTESKPFKRRSSPRLGNSNVKFPSDYKILNDSKLKDTPILIKEPSIEDVTEVDLNGKLQKEPGTPEPASSVSSQESKYLDEDYIVGESSPESKSQRSPIRQKPYKMSSKRKLRHSEELVASRISTRLNRESRNLRNDPSISLKFSKNSDKTDSKSLSSGDSTSDLGSSKLEVKNDPAFSASNNSNRNQDEIETDNSGNVSTGKGQEDEEDDDDDDDVTVLNEIKIPRPNGEVIRELTISSKNRYHNGSPNKRLDKRKIVFQKLPSLNVTNVLSNIVDTKLSPKSIRRNRAIGVYYSKTGSTRQYIFSNKTNPISNLTNTTSVIVTSKPLSNGNNDANDDDGDKDGNKKIEDLSEEKEVEIKEDEIKKKSEKRIMRESGLLSRSSSDVEMSDKINHNRIPSDSIKPNPSNNDNINSTNRKADYISENESLSKLSEDTYEPTRAFGRIESDDEEDDEDEDDKEVDDRDSQSQVINGDIIPDSQTQSQSVPLTQSHIDSLDSSNKNSDVMIVQETMYVSDTTDDEEAKNGDDRDKYLKDESHRDNRKTKRTYSGKKRGRKKKKI